MEYAKVVSKGQITIPMEIRKKLRLKDGDKVIFLEEDGNIVIKNAAMVALREVQRAFDGEAERLGLQDEQDIVDMVKDVRADMWNESHAGNG